MKALAAGYHPFAQGTVGRRAEGLWSIAEGKLLPREQLARALAAQDAGTAAAVLDAERDKGQAVQAVQSVANGRVAALWARVLT